MDGIYSLQRRPGSLDWVAGRNSIALRPPGSRSPLSRTTRLLAPDGARFIRRAVRGEEL